MYHVTTGQWLFSSPPPQWQASDITQITPVEPVYYYKEQGYDSQQVPVLHGF